MEESQYDKSTALVARLFPWLIGALIVGLTAIALYHAVQMAQLLAGPHN